MTLNISLLKHLKGQTKLGEGSFGIVRKKLYASLPVAVKTLKSSDKEAFEELRREQEYLLTLRHPNIINIIAYDEKNIVMELADGNASQHFATDDIHLIGRDCMRALLFMHAHDKCIMHGDIKPENIVLYGNYDQNGNRVVSRALLADVGLSRACNHGKTGFFGTKGYMPQLKSGESPNSFHDIFALSVSLMSMYDLRDLSGNPVYGINNVYDTYYDRKKADFVEGNVQEVLEFMGNVNIKATNIFRVMLLAKDSGFSNVDELLTSLVNSFDILLGNKYVVIDTEELESESESGSSSESSDFMNSFNSKSSTSNGLPYADKFTNSNENMEL